MASEFGKKKSLGELPPFREPPASAGGERSLLHRRKQHLTSEASRERNAAGFGTKVQCVPKLKIRYPFTRINELATVLANQFVDVAVIAGQDLDAELLAMSSASRDSHQNHVDALGLAAGERPFQSGRSRPTDSIIAQPATNNPFGARLALGEEYLVCV